MTKKTIIYTSDTCAYCPMVKKFAKHFNVEYEERNISNPTNEAEALKMARTVPITVRGESFVVGYQPGKLRSIFQG